MYQESVAFSGCHLVSICTFIVIVVFIGQENSYATTAIPPSEFPNVGWLRFLHSAGQHTDDLTNLKNEFSASKCLFITQSPYSAGILQQTAKGMYITNSS